ncbi:hypothetical protein B7463_g2013, partial [Scytalidium lignicola]
MDALPSEIILHVALFLEPREIVTLQLVSKRFSQICRDGRIWREQCFLTSTFLARYRERRDREEQRGDMDAQWRQYDNRQSALGNATAVEAIARAMSDTNALNPRFRSQAGLEWSEPVAHLSEKVRIRANWDPSYLGEKVRWYDEYIARNSTISMSWLQQPRNMESPSKEYLEVSGMALYTPPGELAATIVISPLDDGSVSIWDLNGSLARKGSIIARSKPGILSIDEFPSGTHTKRSEMVKAGVTECISVDSFLKRAYVAVQSGLVEVDLETLKPVSYEMFPFTVTTLSTANYPVPLTVGTNLSIYLHDPRETRRYSASEPEQLDDVDGIVTPRIRAMAGLMNQEYTPRYAHLYQPGPLSILHMPVSGGWDGGGDIYIAGRFPSILHYDRRYFPRLQDTIHSGARLCGLAYLPYAVGNDLDLARRGDLSVERAWETKSHEGKTLIACGEYNTKGSLEMYGLPSPGEHTDPDSRPNKITPSVMQNRQTSSSSKLLSVANHGTRIVVSDGGGNVKWFERDGFTEVRRWNIAQESVETTRSIFGNLRDYYIESQTGDIALKLLPTGSAEGVVNEDNLVLWTGEKLGLLKFTPQPEFTQDSFEEAPGEEDSVREREAHIYGETMRRALIQQANEVRYVQGLGFGLGDGV